MTILNPVVLACIALLALLLFGLGFLVSMTRQRARISMGVTDDHDHALNRRVRAHANTAEFAPFFALLFLAHGLREPSVLVLGLIVAATAARYLIVLGLFTAKTVKRGEPLRFVGALGTYVFGLWLAVLLVL